MTIDKKKMAELEGVAETDLDGEDFVLDPVEVPAVLPARARKPASTEPVRVAPGVTLHPGGGLVIERATQTVGGLSERQTDDRDRGCFASPRGRGLGI